MKDNTKQIDFYDIPEINSETQYEGSTLIPLLDSQEMKITNDLLALEHEFDKREERRIFALKTLYNGFFSGKDVNIFTTPKSNLRDTNFKTYDVNIVAEEIAASGNFLLGVEEDKLVVYKYNEKLKFTQVKAIRTHLLFFLIKTGTLSVNVRNVMYNIVLTLVEQKVERIDIWLDNILFMLEIENVNDLTIHNEYLICKYKSGLSKILNRNFKLVNELEAAPDIENGSNNIESYFTLIPKDMHLELDYKNKDYVQIVETGKIKNICIYDKHVFVLTEESLKILHFSA